VGRRDWAPLGYPIHPRAAAQFRAALYPSGAKDDPVEADLLLDMLVLHR
jgi:hypothetical protein